MDSEIIKLIVPLISVLLASIAIFLSYKQSKRVNRQIKLARETAEALSTKFIGEFPNYNKNIAKLISQAKKKVDLFYDVPGYGLVSDHDSAVDIIREIVTKIRKNNEVNVSISVYTPRMIKKVIFEQLSDTDFDEWKESENVKPRIIQFLKNYTDGISLSELTMESYIEYSAKEHDRIVNTDFKGAEINYIDELIPIYFWMIDKEQAIFSIPTYSEGISEHGFMTKDNPLINALTKMKERYSR